MRLIYVRSNFTHLMIIIALAYTFVSSRFTNAQTVREVLEGVYAARESELTSYYAEFNYEGRLLGNPKDFRARRVYHEGAFKSISKRDANKVWYAGYRDGEIVSSFTSNDDHAFLYGGQLGSILYQGIPGPDEVTGLYRYVDPRALGLGPTVHLVSTEYVRIGLGLHPEAPFYDQIKEDTLDDVPVWILNGKLQEVSHECVIDRRNFRLISRTVKEQAGDISNYQLSYSDRFATQTIPSKVILQTILDGNVIFQGTWEMTEFDPNPKFTEDDFGMASLGMPAGTEFFDEASKTIKTWSGTAVLSPNLATNPRVSRDVIAKKAAEEAAKDSASKAYVLYGLAILGVLCAGLIIARQIGPRSEKKK